MIWIPLDRLVPFYNHLEQQGYDIDNMPNSELEQQWLLYSKPQPITEPIKPSWLKRFNPFQTEETAAL